MHTRESMNRELASMGWRVFHPTTRATMLESLLLAGQGVS